MPSLIIKGGFSFSAQESELDWVLVQTFDPHWWVSIFKWKGIQGSLDGLMIMKMM